MDGNPLKIIVVGGGTAGWMAAASLTKLLGKSLDVTLVESDAIGTVGVGEATIPTLLTLHNLLKIDEREFLTATNGTIKLGIQFENWLQKGHRYIHSFGYTGESCWAAGFHHFWLKGRELGFADPKFGRYAPELVAAENERFGFLPQAPLNYAYHMDATAYARFLRNIAENHGARRVEGRIIGIDRVASGDIQSVNLENGTSIPGDLFLDCSGFSGLLIDKTLSVPFEDYSTWLPCDRAVAVQTEGSDPLRPYTRSIAHEAGWRWQIPLQHRVGNGLVYSSEYMDEDSAVQKLFGQLEASPISEPRHISFQTGQRKRHWDRNCVSIGLSASFIEPLESTSIHLISRAIIRLMQMLPCKGSMEREREEFNRQMFEEVEFIKDFIVLHYHLNQRDEPFWMKMSQMELPASLKHRIALFTHSAKIFQKQGDVFGENSWTQVMLGQGLYPSKHHPIVDLMSESELSEFITHQGKKVDAVVRAIPSHSEFLDRYLTRTAPTS